MRLDFLYNTRLKVKLFCLIFALILIDQVLKLFILNNYEINQSKQIIDQLGLSLDGIIYNDYSRPKRYYGYYDLYGDYSYRYYAERYLYDDYYEEKDD